MTTAALKTTYRLLVAAMSATFWFGWAPPVIADDARFTPTIAAAVGNTGERLRFETQGYEQLEDRALLDTRLYLGLSTRLPRLGPLPLRSETTLGYGLVYHTGHDLLQLRQSGLFDLELGAGFFVPFGLSAGASINVESTSRSSFDLGIPLGLRYRALELLTRPAYVFPLGSARRKVLAGYRELSAQAGVRLFDVMLRVRIEGLDF